MFERKVFRNRVAVALLGLVFSASIACGPSAVTQGDQDKAKQPAAVQASSSPVTMVLGVTKQAPPPPPGGTPARPPLTTPAFYYEPVGPFFFYVETLTANGPNKYGFAPPQPCIQSGVFKRGQKMVVRFEILDTKSGKR